MRVVKWGAVVVLLLLAVGAAAAYFIFDREYLRQRIAGGIGAALGREASLERVELDFGWTTDLTLHNLRIANADWAEAPAAAEIGQARLRFKVWPLIWGDFRFERVEVSKSRIAIERDAEGRLNWDLTPPAETATDVAAPEARGDFPQIGLLRIEDTELSYVDRAEDLTLAAAVTAETSADDPQIRITLDGTLQDAPLKASFVGGPIAALRGSQEPYPINLEIVQGETSATIEGTLAEPVKLQGVDVRLALEGPNLAAILPALDLPLPKTPPYRVAGRLTRKGEVWGYAGFEGVVGDSDLAGDVAVDVSADKPQVNARLHSKALEFEDLAGLVGGSTASDKDQPEEQTFPNEPIDLERLHAANMKVELKTDRLIAPDLPITSLATTVTVRDGHLQAEPLQFGTVGGGSVSGWIGLDGRKQVPAAELDLVLQKVDLRPFFHDTEFVQEMGGAFSGRVHLTGTGRSLAEMMTAAHGEAVIAMRDGRVSGLLVEAAGVDVLEALAVVVGDDPAVPIRCGRIDATVDQGVITAEEAIVDTTDSTLAAQGTIDLGAETLRIQIEAHAKDFSLIDATAPVLVEGDWSDPSFAIGGLDPLPFFEVGEQKDLDCKALVAGATDRPKQARPKE